MMAGAKRKVDDWEEWGKDDENEEVSEPEPWQKYFRGEEEVEDLPLEPVSKHPQFLITCSLSKACSSLPPFSSRSAYKDHCRSIHHNPCSICKRILPSKHLLDLHLKELHDSFFSVLAERENSYECFVEGCVRKCSGPFKRKLHLMDAHQFPHSFDFHVILGKGQSAAPAIKAKSPKKSPQFLPRSPKSLPKQTSNTPDSMDEDQSTPPAAASTTKKRNKNRRKKSTQGQQDQPLSDDEMQTEPPSSNLNVAAEDESSNNQEDPFQSLIGNLKKLSLVPRSVTAKSKTQVTSTAVAGVSKISDNNSNIVSQAIPSSLPHHPKPIVTISKTESWTTSNSSFTSVSDASDQASTCKSLAKATSSVGILAPKYQGHLANSGGVWSKDKVLALYKARVPERAKEAERIWKEARALRAAAPKGEGMVVEDLDMEV